MRLSPLWLVAGAGVLSGVNASTAPSPAHSNALVARDQTPAHLLHARSPFFSSIIGDLLGGLVGHLPSSNWRCNGRGNDGWSVDIYGKGRPSWVPATGWAYFGVEIGWAPIAGWSCPSSFELPSAFIGVCGKVTWWKPSTAWLNAHTSVDLSFSPPSWWGVISLPSRGWRCDGSGKDGWELDIYGKGRPSWVPSGWAYFGVEIGWAPTASWSCSSSFELPAAFIDVCGKVTWWKPSAGWLSAHTSLDLDFTPPSFWGVISVPARGWKCDGSGKDGWELDIYGKGRPSWVPSGWAYFGVEIGWAPSASWSCSSSFELPSAFIDVCGKVTWWKPSAGWLSAHTSLDLDFTPPSFWGIITVPSRRWKCDGSGKDGWELDIYGKGRPSWVPSGWAYFGVEIGWAPTASWSCSSSFELPSAFIDVCGKVTWWKPSAVWLSAHTSIDLDFTPPSFWGVISVPSRGWKCDGSGKDGWELDIYGKGRPSWVPSGWAYFGAEIGWAPTASWSCSSSFELPSAFIDVCGKVTWWKPSAGWLSAHTSLDLDFTPPTFWGIITVPSRGWQCNGKGTDGLEIDYLGNKAPSWVPAGWLWFGVSIGWAPPAGWLPPSVSWTIPRQWEGSLAHKCTWWRPSSGWVSKHRDHDFGWSLPIGWNVPSCGCSCGCTGGGQVTISTSVAPPRPTNSSVPPQTSSRPVVITSTKPQTTSSVKPKNTTSVKPKTTSSKPPATTSRAVKTTKPPSTQTIVVTGPTKVVTVTETETIPAPVPTQPAPGKPTPGWQCDGSGKDGYEVDHNGNGCPSHLGGGTWLWFGSSIGWAPPQGWTITIGWKPSSIELGSCGKVNWWLPPAGLIIPGSLKCPLSWTFGGWVDVRIPSIGFQCDGSGEDGFDFDHYGNSRPSWVPVGWQWFGVRSGGWQPCKDWTPSASWSVSHQWQAHYARWWQPKRQITLRSGFRCPSWWRKSYLRGSWRWL